MYAIYSDDNLIYSPGSASSLGYSLSSPKLTTEINKAGSLEFTIPSTNPNYGKLAKLKSIIRIEQDGTEIWRGRVLNDEKDFYNNKTVFCEGELAFLNDAVVPPYDYSSGITLRNYFTTMLSYYTNNCSEYRMIRAGNVTAADPNVTITAKAEDYSDVMTELSINLAGSMGGYFQLRRSGDVGYLDYLDSLDHISDQKIVFGRNLLDLTEYVDASEVYTYIIPLGKKNDSGVRVDISSVNGGVNYLASSVGEQTFGRITKAVAWDDVTDPSTLKTLGQNLLDEVIQMATSIEISALDLQLLGVDVSRLQIGEFVPVSSPPHGIDANFLCSKIVLDLQEPERSQYTFGLVFSALTDKQVADAKQSENAYQTAKDTSNAYNSLRTEVYENYVSSSRFEAFQSEVEEQFAAIGEITPENYLTTEEAERTYATIQALEVLEGRVSLLEEKVNSQGGTE